MSERYVLFDTAFGTCGVAWSGGGFTRLQLPERDRRATEQRLMAGSAVACEQLVPEQMARVIVALQQYFEGRAVDLRGVALDLDRVSPFHRKAYEAARSIGYSVGGVSEVVSADAFLPSCVSQ